MSSALVSRFSWGRPRSEFLPVRGVTAAIWAAAAAVVVYWMAQMGGGEAVPVPIARVAMPLADADSIARLLGATPVLAPSQPVVRVKATLLGVVAQGRGDAQAGAALISLDGAPARPYRVGAEVADGYRLAALDTRGARLTAPGQPDWRLEMSHEYASSASSASNAVTAPARPRDAARAQGQSPAASPAHAPISGVRRNGVPARPVSGVAR
ncbi:MAG: hypothetical protein QM617_06385 [Comamonas sp.]